MSRPPATTPARVAVIWGPTASGKTALALALAARWDAEIVSVDSRQVYRGMDIGTAKATAAERAQIPHHLIDIREPDEPFSLAEFLALAGEAIADITRRGRRAVVAGGTGQYVRALIEGWQAPAVPPDPERRARILARAAEEGGAALHTQLAALDPAAAAGIDPRNTRRVVRALEVIEVTGRRFSEQRRLAEPPFTATVIGLRLTRAALYARIDRRVEEMYRTGLVDEVQALTARGFGCDLPAMRSIGYAEVCSYLRGDSTLTEATARTKTGTHRLARMQSTWFRDADPRVHWLDAGAGPPIAEAARLLSEVFGPAR